MAREVLFMNRMVKMALFRVDTLVLMLILTCAGVQGSAAADCDTVDFRSGATSVTLEGNAPADGVACIDLPAEAGQAISLRLAGEDDILFSIEGVVDGQNTYSFMAESRSYNIVVFQLTRAAQAEPFSLAITRTGAAPAAGGWSVVPDRANGRVSTSVTAIDRTTQILGGCGPGVRGFTFTMTYAGDKLKRVDDGQEPVTVLFDFANRDSASHEIAMYYFAPDLAHVVVGGLTGRFLSDFAEGSAMRLANALGEEIAEIALSGTSRLRATMREICGI
jgi:hypothetical protein